MKLSIQHLGKTYQDGAVALKDFGWDLDNGVYGLLGPNGAGKSTLLEILSLNLMPSSGRVLWEGLDIQKHSQAYRRILGYLPQTYGIYPELRAGQFLAYVGRLSGLGGRALKRRIGECLELVNLTPFRRRKIKSFSGGMRQRFAIAQALLHRPELLVIDEPTTGLDPGERVAFRNMLFDLGRETVVLLSTHIVKDVAFSCRNMTLLYKGVQQFTGSPADFIGEVRGRVVELTISFDRFLAFSQKHQVVAIREEGDMVHVRFIVPREGDALADTERWAEASGVEGRRPEPVEPNLEDAYVAFIREHQSDSRQTVPLATLEDEEIPLGATN